ncbi:MAG TPA: hypothetical protein VFS30_01585 [Dehalococcoidia bacterium]|nr:hypothetical protein [Dehalococcoidia bacterium]
MLDVRRLQLLGALQEGSMGQLVWGSNGQPDRPAALYAFRREMLTLHEVLRDGSLDRLEVSLPVEASAAFSHTGVRPWLSCPNPHDGRLCGRRVTRLLLIAGEMQLRCRFCVGRRHDLRLLELTEASSHTLAGSPSPR